MEVVSVFNDKGGVGKTAIALELASGLTIAGKTILLVDNDPQGTLSRCCLGKSFEIGEGIDRVYANQLPINEVTYETWLPNMFITPSGTTLKNYYNLVNESIKNAVEEMFDTIRGRLADVIDIVIFDNPPTQTGIALECTINADRIVIPSRPDDVCFDALVRTYAFLENQIPDFQEKSITIFPAIFENRKMHRNFTNAMHKRYDLLNGNTHVGTIISNRAEVPTTIMEKKALYIAHAASETAQQHKQMCVDVFPWLNRDKFFASLEEAAEAKKIEIRQKFKDMVKLNLQKRPSKEGLEQESVSVKSKLEVGK